MYQNFFYIYVVKQYLKYKIIANKNRVHTSQDHRNKNIQNTKYEILISKKVFRKYLKEVQVFEIL